MVLTTASVNRENSDYGTDAEGDTSTEMKQLGLGSEAPAKASSVKNMSANSVKGSARPTSSAMKGE